MHKLRKLGAGAEMKLPTTIRIGGHKFKVVELPADTDLHGECDVASHEFRLAKVFADDSQAADTILHEIMHGLWDQAHLVEGDSEERVVYVLAGGLIQVIRDNKTLFRQILKALK